MRAQVRLRSNSHKPIVNYKTGCIRLAVASDNAYQLLAHCGWFSSCTPGSSTTKTGRHDIAESDVKHNHSIIFSLKIKWK